MWILGLIQKITDHLFLTTPRLGVLISIRKFVYVGDEGIVGTNVERPGELALIFTLSGMKVLPWLFLVEPI
jgi:hypothetical protein